jgi:hypothetical protein
VAVALLVAALLPACGGDDGSGEAKKTLAEARESFLAASSVRIQGRLASDGKPVVLDLVLVGERGGRGTITADGTTFQLIRIGEVLWFKAPRAFYAKQPALPVDLLAGRWLEGPAANSQFSELAAFTRASKVAAIALSTGEDLKSLPSVANGAPAIALSTSKGSLTVSAAPPRRPLRADGAPGTGVSLVFSAYGAKVDLRKPAGVVTAAQVAAAQAK